MRKNPLTKETGRKKCGVYSATNVLSGKVYVGASRDMGKRMAGHIQQTYVLRYSSELYNDMNKHGREAFDWDILEVCPKDVLRDRERHYISQAVASPSGAYNRNCTIRDELDLITFSVSQSKYTAIKRCASHFGMSLQEFVDRCVIDALDSMDNAGAQHEAE